MNELPELPHHKFTALHAESDWSCAKDIPAFTADQMRSYALSAVQAERERCARICDAIDKEEKSDSPYYGIAKECAAAIRSPAKE